MFNTSFLFASLFWSSIGLGYFVYGKKQRSWVPMSAGALMMAASYFVGSVLMMSLVCSGLIAAAFFLVRLGY